MLFGRISIWRTALLSCLFAVVVSACGGSDSTATLSSPESADSVATVTATSSGDVANTEAGIGTAGAGVVANVAGGSLAVMLTDAPSDEFSEINLTINSVNLLASDGGNFELFNGRQVVNLLGLRNYSNLFTVNHDVPPGLYSKIRMQLEDVELVRTDENGIVTERVHPKLVANGKMDLNSRTEFAIGPGKSLVLQLDMDAKKSIQLHQSGGGKGKGKASEYHFRPVVFIDIIDMVNFGGKLVREEGLISKIDGVAGTVELCNTYSATDKRCVVVKANSGTKIYDRTGQLITLDTKQLLTYGIAVGYLSLVNGENRMDAEVIELGARSNYLDDYMHVSGNVTTPPVDDSHLFYFGIRPTYGFNPGEIFRVLPMPGAKLFSSNGAQLDWSALATGKVVEIEGLLDHSSAKPYTFKATIVYLDMTQVTTQMSGVISSVDLSNKTLVLVTADLGDRCVVASDAVNVYQVSGSADSGYSGQRITFEQIKSGQYSDIYGHMDGAGCYVADDILVQ